MYLFRNKESWKLKKKNTNKLTSTTQIGRGSGYIVNLKNCCLFLRRWSEIPINMFKMLEKYSNHYKLCIIIYSILLSMKTLFKVNAHICYILLDLVRISVITADFSYSIHRFLNILYAYLLCKEAVQRKAQYVCGVTTSVCLQSNF